MGNKVSSRRRSNNRNAELYCQPTGLYPSCPWDQQTVKRWIVEGKVAPRFPYIKNPELNNIECPICFYCYKGVNKCVCCGQPLCTECYLQLCPPRSNTTCPFCNSVKFAVKYNGPETKSEAQILEEQAANEARTRAARLEHTKSQSASDTNQRNVAESEISTVSNVPGNSNVSSTIVQPNLEFSVQVPLASGINRNDLEVLIREQLNSVQSSSIPSDTPNGLNTQRSNNGAQSAMPSERQLELARAYGTPRLVEALSTNMDTSTIEELMLAEALRRSVEETNENVILLNREMTNEGTRGLLNEEIIRIFGIEENLGGSHLNRSSQGLIQHNATRQSQLSSNSSYLYPSEGHVSDSFNSNGSLNRGASVSVSSIPDIESIPHSEMGDLLLAMEMSMRDISSSFNYSNSSTDNSNVPSGDLTNPPSYSYSQRPNASAYPPIPGNPFDIYLPESLAASSIALNSSTLATPTMTSVTQTGTSQAIIFDGLPMLNESSSLVAYNTPSLIEQSDLIHFDNDSEGEEVDRSPRVDIQSLD